MSQFITLINQNCRTATRLVSDAQERPLTRLERVGLAIHLFGCRSCRRYRKQIHMLDKLAQTFCDRSPTDSLSPSARERINKRLREIDKDAGNA